MVSIRNWKQLGVLLIQSTSSRPRIVLSILDGSGRAALGIQIDWRGNRTGLFGSRDASRENSAEVRGSINTGPVAERNV